MQQPSSQSQQQLSQPQHDPFDDLPPPLAASCAAAERAASTGSSGGPPDPDAAMPNMDPSAIRLKLSDKHSEGVVAARLCEGAR